MRIDKVLITGINGFLGKSLKHYVKSEYPSWSVYGIDKEIKESKSEFKLDLKDKDKLKKLLLRLKPKYIFHLCGNTASKDFKKLLISNVYTTFTLFDAIKEIKNYTPRIVIPSSAAEYGNLLISKPLKEKDSLKPVSSYGFSKALQTEISLMFAKQNLDIVIARMFNITGWAVPTNLCVGRFAHQLTLIKKGEKKSILYTKALDTKRDFLDIRDVCKYLTTVTINGKRGEVYNICRGKSYSVRHLLNKLVKISGIKKLTIIEDKNFKQIDIMDSCGSTYKLKKIVKDFKPIPIDKSLKDTHLYYLSSN